MGQVAHIEEVGLVAEILDSEITPAQVQAARRFVESFQFTTCALFALEVALREQYNELDPDGPASLADLLGGIIRPAAELEAVEL